MSITLNDTQQIQVQTHIELIQKAHAKIQAQQYATNELEKDFQGFINVIISDNGEDPNRQYSYNLETGTLEVEESETNTVNNGTGVDIPENPAVGTSFDS